MKIKAPLHRAVTLNATALIKTNSVTGDQQNLPYIQDITAKSV